MAPARALRRVASRSCGQDGEACAQVAEGGSGEEVAGMVGAVVERVGEQKRGVGKMGSMTSW